VLVDDGDVEVGDRHFRVELRRRVDGIGHPDPWLGHVHDHTEGIVLLLDRVTSFTLDSLWPLLDGALEPELDPLARRFAPAVRAEVREALGDASLELLALTASDRVAMLASVGRIHARHACGSAFVVSRLPWNGLSTRDLATLRLHTGGEEDACPEVLPDEAMLFATRSYHLQRTPGVREALEGLVAFVAESVVVHEARHAADDAVLQGQRIPCVGCPKETSHVSALESSAYLASFADPQHGALALYQACGLDREVVPERAAMIAFLADRLVEGGCGAAPPVDLAERAVAMERELHLRSDPVHLVDFPDSLPVSSEYTAP
jgi:hypothetical protein